MGAAASAAPARDLRWRRLQQLPRFEEVRERLQDGQSPEYVARVIQEEMGQFQDVPVTTLASLLRLYRLEVMGLDFPENPARDVWVDRIQRRIAQRVNLYDHYAFLIEAQRYRVELAMAREDAAGLLAPGLFQDLRVLKETLAEFAEFQMETGMLPRVAREVDASVVVRPGMSDGERRFRLGLIEQRDAVRVAEQALELVRAIDAKRREGNDGGREGVNDGAGSAGDRPDESDERAATDGGEVAGRERQ